MERVGERSEGVGVFLLLPVEDEAGGVGIEGAADAAALNNCGWIAALGGYATQGYAS